MYLAYGQEVGSDKAHDIPLSMETRLKSVYCIGSSGSGKSSMLETWMAQDIHEGVGWTLFDVEDRLTTRMLRHLRDAGKDHRTLVVDPTLGVLPLNILAVPDGEHPHSVVEGAISAFKRAWFAEWGPRLEDLLRHSLIAFVEARLTLGELPHFLSNQAFRERVAEQSQDERVRSYFLDHLRNVPAREWRTWVESTRNKVAAFASNPFVAPCLSTDTCLDFQRAMDEGWYIVVNLSERMLGDSGRLLGMLLVSRFFQAALRRNEGARPHIIYADEFQNLASKSFVDLVTRARKRGVGAVLAHQTTHQPPFDKNPEFLSAILGTCATHVVLQIGREDAERFAKEIFPSAGVHAKHREKHPIWGDFGRIERYSVQEEREQQMEELQDLRPRECLIKIKELSGTKVYMAEAYDLPEPEATDDEGLTLAKTQVSLLGVSRETLEEQKAARLDRFSPKRRLNSGS